MRRAVSSRPVSSICTPTCASPVAKRPRRSRPAPGPRHSAATPQWSPCPTPSRPSTLPQSCARSSTSAHAAAGGRPGRRRHHRRPSGQAAGAAWPRWPTSACASSPTTATACRTPRLMRRALEYAGALGVTLAQHCEDDSLASGGHMHEGEWSSRLGIPGMPAEAEEVMVAARHRPRPPDRRPRPLPAPVDRRVAGHGRRAQAAKACPSPPRSRPTTSP